MWVLTTKSSLAYSNAYCLLSMDLMLVLSILQINSLKQRLNNLREVLKEISQDNIDRVPTADKIDVTKLCNGANITTYTCNVSQKLRGILVETIGGCYEFDCMHHLCNVWFGNMERKLTSQLTCILRSSLGVIDPTLRVSASISALIRAITKEFSLLSNYTKRH